VRLGIAMRLAEEGGTCACDFAEIFGVSQPTVSQHLKVLRDAGLVAVRADGQRRLYMVRPDGLASVEAFLAELWPASLRRLKQAVESEPESESGPRA
jgi:DNA-binding transcriptional ArsR family regulator